MAAVKEETWVWVAMAAALLAAVWWFRKRKPIGTIPTGVGSTIGSTIANQPSAPLPVSTIPIQGGLPLHYNGSYSGAGGGDLAGQVTIGLGGTAPVLTTTGTGATAVSTPVFTRPKRPQLGGTPILVPRQGPTLVY